MNNQLPEIFEEFGEARKNGFLSVKKLKDEGKNVVGTFCTYTPKEVIYAAGACPVSLCSVSEETIPVAEERLPKNLCPLVKASYGFAITDKCPYMYFSDLVVGETTCDGKKKMYELLSEIKNTHVMQLPQTQETDRAKQYWREEVQALVERLESEFSVVITKENLIQAIELCNEERKNLIEFYELGKLIPPPMSGLEIHTTLNGSNYSFDKELQNQNVKTLIKELKEKHANGKCEISKDAPRILVTGCPSGGVVDKVIKQIETAGGVVVCFENCIGTKNMENLVEINDDPIGAIAERYLKVSCSVMTPNNQRKQTIKEYIKEYQVDGVIDVILTACHTFNIETDGIKKATEEAGASYMALETNYSPGDFGQIQTRLEAFIEIL